VTRTGTHFSAFTGTLGPSCSQFGRGSVRQLGLTTFLGSARHRRRVSMAIHSRYAPAVLEKSLPSGAWSKADYGERAVGGRIQGRQPNLRSRLDESPRFYVGSRTLLLAWVSCLSNWHSTLLPRTAYRDLLVRLMS
jgi:hypothetical protein